MYLKFICTSVVDGPTEAGPTTKIATLASISPTPEDLSEPEPSIASIVVKMGTQVAIDSISEGAIYNVNIDIA